MGLADSAKSSRMTDFKALLGTNRRQLLFSALMGATAFAVRNAGLYVLIYPPFRFDPRWVFSLLAACWAGPGGGLIASAMAATKLPYPLIDLAAIPAHILVGFVARWLTLRRKNNLYACFLWPLAGVPLYWLATLLFTPVMATIALVPVLVFIGVSSALLALVIGLAVEKRASGLLNLLKV